MKNLRYKGYLGSIEYSEEDECLYGKVLGMSGDCITYEGETIKELKEDFEGAIDYYLASCKAREIEPKQPFSGHINIRIPREVHARIAALAQQTGTTINGYIRNALENQLKCSHE